MASRKVVPFRAKRGTPKPKRAKQVKLLPEEYEELRLRRQIFARHQQVGVLLEEAVQLRIRMIAKKYNLPDEFTVSKTGVVSHG